MRFIAANLNDLNVNLHDQEVDCGSLRFDAQAGVATVDVWVDVASRDDITTPIRMPILGLPIAWRTIGPGWERRCELRFDNVLGVSVKNTENVDSAPLSGIHLARDGKRAILGSHMPFEVEFHLAEFSASFEETGDIRDPNADGSRGAWRETISLCPPTARPDSPPPSP